MILGALLSLVVLGCVGSTSSVITTGASAHVNTQLSARTPSAQWIEREREKASKHPMQVTLRQGSKSIRVPNCSRCSIRLPPNTIPYDNHWMWEWAKNLKLIGRPRYSSKMKELVRGWTSPDWFESSGGYFSVLGEVDLSKPPLGFIFGDSFVSNVRVALLNVSHFMGGYFLIAMGAGCQPLLSDAEYTRKRLTPEADDYINVPNRDDLRCHEFSRKFRNAIEEFRRPVPILAVVSSRNHYRNLTDYGYYYSDFTDFVISLPVEHPLAFLGSTPSLFMQDHPKLFSEWRKPTNETRWHHPDAMFIKVYNDAERAVEGSTHPSRVHFLPTARLFCGQDRLDRNALCLVAAMEDSGLLSQIWKDGAGHLAPFGSLFLEPLLHRAFEKMQATISKLEPHAQTRSRQTNPVG